MSEVAKYKLSDIARFKYGTMPKKDNMIASGYPIFSGYQFNGYYKTYQYDTHKLIVIARGVGGTGEVRIAPAKCHITNLSIIFDELNECIANEYYLLYYFRKYNLRELDSGSAQSQITIGDLENYVIEIPQLHTQRKIVEVLSIYDNLIENNNRRMAILEEMAQRLYREWFVHFRFPGHENVEMVDSELGMIPEGWDVETVKDIVVRQKNGTVYTEATVQEEGNVPVIDQSTSELLGFHNNSIDHDASIEHPIAIFGDHTCKMQLLVHPFSIGPNVVAFTASQQRELIYVFYAVKSLIETKEYKRHWNEFMIKKVVIPERKIETLFANRVSPFLRGIDYLNNKNRLLRKTRDHLLPCLISGDVDVSKIEKI